MDKQKDIWDKLDIIGKFFTAAVLGLIALFLKTGSDNIAVSLKKGDLVKSLISDLTAKENPVRQDIALIALDYSVEEGNKDGGNDMVANIAERVFSDIRPSDTTKVGNETGKIAFQILTKRNPERALALQNEILTTAQNPTTRASLRSSPGLAKAEVKSSDEARLIARVAENIIYIQYKGTIPRDTVEALRKLLATEGYNAPGVEKVTYQFDNSIRYYHSQDKPLANKIAVIATNYLKTKNININFKLVDLSNRKYKAQTGQVELWIDL